MQQNYKTRKCVITTELAKICCVGKGKITDITKRKNDIKNYLSRVDSSDAGSGRKTLNTLT